MGDIERKPGRPGILRVYAAAHVPSLDRIHAALNMRAAERRTQFQPFKIPAVILKELWVDDPQFGEQSPRSVILTKNAEVLAKQFGNVALHLKACAVMPGANDRKQGRVAALGALLDHDRPRTSAAEQLIKGYFNARQHRYIGLQLGTFVADVAAGNISVEGIEDEPIVLKKAEVKIAQPRVMPYSDYR